MEQPITIIFMGSFQDYSAQVLSSLIESQPIEVTGVITTPPILDKKKNLQLNPVHQLAEKHQIPVLTPQKLDEDTLTQIEKKMGRPQLILTAGYGKLLPNSFLSFPKIKALNLHFSLLPAYRGANPGEYALLNGETKTGITLMEMDEKFDTGQMLQQASLEIDPQETRVSLYEKLYLLGQQKISSWISEYLEGKTPQVKQTASPTLYAQKLNKEDGFIAWDKLREIMNGEEIAATNLSLQMQKILSFHPQKVDASFVEKMSRALYQYPTLWTKIPTNKGPRRMIIWEVEINKNNDHSMGLSLVKVQIAGQEPAKFNQIKNMIID